MTSVPLKGWRGGRAPSLRKRDAQRLAAKAVGHAGCGTPGSLSPAETALELTESLDD
ncbi:MAG: hypothetical protein K8H74_15515 [Notoacmeibacter sp.]|nr:hypothetical protein [Notoacmeibacter sp.]